MGTPRWMRSAAACNGATELRLRARTTLSPKAGASAHSCGPLWRITRIGLTLMSGKTKPRRSPATRLHRARRRRWSWIIRGRCARRRASPSRHASDLHPAVRRRRGSRGGRRRHPRQRRRRGCRRLRRRPPRRRRASPPPSGSRRRARLQRWRRRRRGALAPRRTTRPPPPRSPPRAPARGPCRARRRARRSRRRARRGLRRRACGPSCRRGPTRHPPAPPTRAAASSRSSTALRTSSVGDPTLPPACPCRRHGGRGGRVHRDRMARRGWPIAMALGRGKAS